MEYNSYFGAGNENNPLTLVFFEANEREAGERQRQLAVLKSLYSDVAEFLPEQVLGTPVPAETDAVLFPQMIGAIFSHRGELEKCSLPIIVLSPEY